MGGFIDTYFKERRVGSFIKRLLLLLSHVGCNLVTDLLHAQNGRMPTLLVDVMQLNAVNLVVRTNGFDRFVDGCLQFRIQQKVKLNVGVSVYQVIQHIRWLVGTDTNRPFSSYHIGIHQSGHQPRHRWWLRK